MQPVYSPSYDGIPLAIISHDTDLAPRIGVHAPAIGRGAQLDDRGRGARIDSLVVKTTGDDAEQLDYRGWLQGLASSGQARRFVHPFDGSWLARLSAFAERAAGGSFEFSMTLIEDVPHTIRADGNQGASATLQALSVAAQALEAATAGLQPQAPSLAGAIPQPSGVLSTLPEQTPRPTAAALDSWRGQAREAQTQLRADTSPSAYEASRALAEFSGLLELYALARASQGRQLHTYTTQRSRPLIVHLTQLYGASHAGRLAAEVAALNGLVDILHVPAGTALRLPRL